jgi:hypothetical protein
MTSKDLLHLEASSLYSMTLSNNSNAKGETYEHSQKK